jgi:hypothetical protein
VKPWLSGLDVPQRQELAGDRLGWRKALKSTDTYTDLACVVGTGQKTEDRSSARSRVGFEAQGTAAATTGPTNSVFAKPMVKI